MTNHKKLIWWHGVTGPEPPFFHKRKGALKINRSVKVLLRRLSIGVVLSIEYLYSTFVLKQVEIKKIQGLPQNNNNEIKPVPGVPEI